VQIIICDPILDFCNNPIEANIAGPKAVFPFY